QSANICLKTWVLLLQRISLRLAQSGHGDRAQPCPLLGVKRTSASICRRFPPPWSVEELDPACGRAQFLMQVKELSASNLSNELRESSEGPSFATEEFMGKLVLGVATLALSAGAASAQVPGYDYYGATVPLYGYAALPASLVRRSHTELF